MKRRMSKTLRLSLLLFAMSIVPAAARRADTGSGSHGTAPAGDAAFQATTAAPGSAVAFEPYTETIPDTNVSFDMVPVPGGRFTIGSPANEPGRGEDEGPQAEVRIEPFWMGKHEVTWDEFDRYRFAKRLPGAGSAADPASTTADAVSKPTPPYVDESWGFGKGKQPAIGMTWHAAAEYCRWLSARTGRTYRLPTEAEWEHAARAGTTTPWSSGPEESSLADVAWYAANADGAPHKVGTKKPNPFGLYDMHGNVAEWILDQYDAARYASLAKQRERAGPNGLINPVFVPSDARYPHVVRGGSFEDDAAHIRSAARRSSEPAWSRQDPQLPQSIWWHTDAIFVGFRVVRAVEEQSDLKDFKSAITEDSPDMKR
ncbi:MAG: SUMF1/EgtB/PvdO family nonheme iron enzyme [Luteitalea sp.]|nr:SUMF1/EgtB/PvdO family nonheme iron enzyme [Luteitalea sp.]